MTLCDLESRDARGQFFRRIFARTLVSFDHKFKFCLVTQVANERSVQRDANTARALAIVRFGHRLPVANTRVTDRTDNNTLRR